jgi:4,5:9,10-diseco-3-hydroxy-5,9,17-trioxoandrosta-1(10),2-diene-4-oate hydrolase
LGGFIELWQKNIMALAECHQVYALDLVGFGRSDKPQVPYSVPYFTQFLHDFMALLKIERASLIGHSMGGGIALLFALQFPHQVDRLVLEANLGFGKNGSLLLRMASLPVMGELVLRSSRNMTIRNFKEIVYNLDSIPQEIIATACELGALPQAQSALLQTLRSIADFKGVRANVLSLFDDIGKIMSPTLILWGNEDRVLPVTQAYIGVKKLPYGTLHVLNQCGHISHLEWPEKFSSMVGEFLS